jgi:predicted PurR-regulated permease PerM
MEPRADALSRDRLLRVIAGSCLIALAFGLPFALKAGAEFFLPATAAMIIAIALVPALNWLERHKFPSILAALVCVVGFVLLINAALAIIILPASAWFIDLPQRLPRIRENLAPLIDFYANLQRFVDDALQSFASQTAEQAEAVAIEAPESLFDYLTSSAPAAVFQTFFALLLIFFLLAGWTRMRQQAISGRGSFDSAMTTARVIQNVVDATAAYLTTIVFINILLGLAVAGMLWLLGMPSPLMWGGIVALCNFVPYVGPVVAAGLLALGGLMTFDSVALALLPAIIQISLHSIEANIITPMVLGRRLTLNPMLILISLSFWGWIWGAPGAFLAVPILLVGQTLWASMVPQRTDPPAPHGTAVAGLDGVEETKSAAVSLNG